MFFFDNRKEVIRTIKIRDEWGVLHDVEVYGMTRGTPRLTDKELAEQLCTSQVTVETHRRD